MGWAYSYCNLGIDYWQLIWLVEPRGSFKIDETGSFDFRTSLNSLLICVCMWVTSGCGVMRERERERESSGVAGMPWPRRVRAGGGSEAWSAA
jgi:hypothetical protein